MKWRFNPNSKSRESFRIEDILNGACHCPPEIEAPMAFMDQSPVGTKLLDMAAGLGTAIALECDLPYYGLAVPPQKVRPYPLVLLGQDERQKDTPFASFVLAHELTHILQDDEQLLKILPLEGITYHSGDDEPLSDKAMHTIITERTADLGASLMCAAHPQPGAFDALRAESSLSQLFMACEQIYKEEEPKLDETSISALIDIKTMDEKALRYYAGYLKNISLSGLFNAHSHGIENFVTAQARFVQKFAL